MKRWLIRLVLASIACFALLQLIPYGRAHTNPPVTAEPTWDSPETRALAQRACFDCHSNQTKWPWYSHVAPVSWLVQHDVDEGRAALNFSEWDKPQDEAHEASEELLEGEMPLPIYLPTHPEARLSDAEVQALARGLDATIGRRGHGDSEHDDDDD